ncbi:MAG: diacylglycerol kinase family lipid kinase [Firmicutes bacterium]|nr:diacylglycerol kinase family lipid kinase [Bacillota bacterium]
MIGGTKMRFKIIANPAAGRGKVAKLAPKIRRLFVAQDLDFELVETSGPGHATELARQAGHDFETVIGVGGDGTMNEVLNGVMETGAAMGFIPCGTGNDFARSLNIPFNLEKAVSVFKTGRMISMDVGKDSDGYFSIILGLGFPSDVMQHVNTRKNIFRGPLAITASILQVVNKLQPYPMHITLDDDELSATVMGLFVLNTRFTGGGLQIAPEARYDDGLLDVVIMHEMNKLGFLTTLPKAYKGKHTTHPKVQFLRTRKLKVTTLEPLPKLFDGNVYGTSPIDAELLPGALRVWVPGADNS